MPLDAAALGRALGAAPPEVHHQLCRRQIDRLRAAAASGEELLVACTQEAPLFAMTVGGDGPPLAVVNIRERAGWSDQAGQATPKIAALLAEAAVEIPPATAVATRSQGRCLVLGDGEVALEAARRLAERLDVTLLLTGPSTLLPPDRDAFPIHAGTILRGRGHLGAYVVEAEQLQVMAVSSRDRVRLEPWQDRATLEADLILDLRGGTPLFTAHARRDGYLRAEPADALAVERALFDATGLVGAFEKPRHVLFDAALCAHSRSRRTGCTRCLDQCPTGAITPAGDHVAIDPWVCAGCGACAGVCPTGAAAYASPSAEALLRRLRSLLGTYLDAGGEAPVLLVHEERHGGALIAAMARLGRGLPARVLPFAVPEIALLGFEFLAGALALGAAELVVLVPPAKGAEVAGLDATAGVVRALLDGLGHDGARLLVVSEDDPDRLEAQLWSMAVRPPPPRGDFVPLGGKPALSFTGSPRVHSIGSLCPRVRRSARSRSMLPAARCASPASAPAPPARCSTIPTCQCCASSRTRASSAACAAPPAPSR